MCFAWTGSRCGPWPCCKLPNAGELPEEPFPFPFDAELDGLPLLKLGTNTGEWGFRPAGTLTCRLC